MVMKNKKNFIELQQNYRIAQISNHPHQTAARNFIVSKSPSNATIRTQKDGSLGYKYSTTDFKDKKYSVNLPPNELNNQLSQGFLPEM